MTLFGILLYAFFFAFLTAYIASRKGYAVLSWFWLGFLLGLLATIILLLQPHKMKEKTHVSDPVSK